MLTVQHRMHPLIHRFPSDQFYDGRLVDGPSALGREPPVIMQNAVTLIDVTDGREEDAGISKQNNAEVNIVVEIVERLFNQGGVPYQSIGVISPYAGQVAALKKKLKSCHGITVKSVDGFQGNEKDVIVLSCVRANPAKIRLGS